MFKNWNSKKVLSSVLSLALLFSCAPTISANSTTAGKSTSEFLENVKSVVSSPKFIVPTAIVGAISATAITAHIYNTKFTKPRNPIETHIKGESDERAANDGEYNIIGAMTTDHIDDYYYFADGVDHRYEIETKVTDILNKMNQRNCKTDFEKAVFLHDYIYDHCKYSMGGLIAITIKNNTHFRTVHTVARTLIDNNAVCQGIADAYMLLLTKAGVACKTIEGSSCGMGHCWNIVKINGRWYHVDVTWDLLFKATHGRYKWFMLSEEEISKDHDGFIMNKD